MLAAPSVSRPSFGSFLAANFGGAVAIGVMGTILVGVIGTMLDGFTLSVAGGLIGVVFMGPLWAVGNTAGVIVGYLVFAKAGKRFDLGAAFTE